MDEQQQQQQLRATAFTQPRCTTMGADGHLLSDDDNHEDQVWGTRGATSQSQ